MLTVADLIRRLLELDPDTVVVVPGYETGVDSANLVEPVQVDLDTLPDRGMADRITTEPNPHAYDFEGEHRLVGQGGTPGC